MRYYRGFGSKNNIPQVGSITSPTREPLYPIYTSGLPFQDGSCSGARHNLNLKTESGDKATITFQSMNASIRFIASFNSSRPVAYDTLR